MMDVGRIFRSDRKGSVRLWLEGDLIAGCEIDLVDPRLREGDDECRAARYLDSSRFHDLFPADMFKKSIDFWLIYKYHI